MKVGWNAIVTGIGAYLPDKVLSNAALEIKIETSDAWIQARTGIKQRHLAADGELTSDLALAASRNALADAGVSGKDLDLIVLATTTPDSTFPATATKVQAALGMTQGAAFDVQAVCAGFIYALSVATNAITTGQTQKALVIGAETFTRLLDWSDRSTCVLFGDGAGAMVLENNAINSAERSGVLSSHLHSDGRFHDLLYVDGGPSSTGTTGHVRMQGPEVFKHAVNKLSEAVLEALDANDLDIKDVDWFVPHQANKRIIDRTADKLGIDPAKVIVTVDQHANTSAASIPLALHQGVEDGRIKKGDLVVLEAIGGGLSWGASVIRW
ncbi:MAG: ketoacyl-ACP synthase III [Rhodospirillaceae bacterium]|nr:ketoacyl-ACP synthase III [Rhodospirillaceae bacterium]MCY4239837.1 ketoacyl-ACP synthase III [Rhodospirillaceae bacterium]